MSDQPQRIGRVPVEEWLEVCTIADSPRLHSHYPLPSLRAGTSFEDSMTFKPQSKSRW